ncbi:MAG: hypothetical protein QXT63_07615 [Thermoplasmata archaeon]
MRYYDYKFTKPESQATELMALRDLSEDDFYKRQILNCMEVANNTPEKLPFSVQMLEMMMIDMLEENGWVEKIRKIEEDVNKKHPGFMADASARIARDIELSMVKFAEIFKLLKKRIPSAIDLTM